MKKSTTSEVLKKFFELKKQRFPGYSIRSLASKLDVSASLASRWLSGKRRLNLKFLNSLVNELEIDSLGKQKLLKSLGVETHGSFEFNNNTKREIEEIADTKSTLFDSWIHFAILNLVGCRNFQSDPKWIAERLSVSTREVLSSWQTLIDMDCIEESNGKWKKKTPRERFLTVKSSQTRTKYYTECFKKVRQTMLKQTQPEDFQRRLVNGVVVGTNPENIDKARAFLEKALAEVAHILSEGDASEVYSVGVQMIPLTKKDPG